MSVVAFRISCLGLLLASLALTSAHGQSNAEKVYETERAFEKMVAEKGVKAGFLEFMAPSGVMFMPEPTNARGRWAALPDSPASLAWNPVWIEVSSNGLLAYSIGNSVYRAKGKNDPNAFHGHYISVWARQPDGIYRAVFDTGVNHEKPSAITTEWKTPKDSETEKNEARLSAADSSTGFWEAVEKLGSIKAYKSYLAEDAILLRDGSLPLIGKKQSVRYLEDKRPRIKFPKRKAFIESADLAYVYDSYTLVDAQGKESERGHYIQVWKLRRGKWLIAADAWIPLPKA